MHESKIKNKHLRNELFKLGLVNDESDYFYINEHFKNEGKWIISSYKKHVRIFMNCSYDENLKDYEFHMLSTQLNVHTKEQEIIELAKQIIDLYKIKQIKLKITNIEQDF